MSTITPQYTESNLVGNLEASISTSVTSILVTFFDRITGLQRTPLASTKLFVIDKGTELFPNSNYEIILAASHSTTNGVTTLTGCTRGIAFSGTSLAAGTGKSHIANAEIGCVDVHYLWTILSAICDGTNAPPASLRLAFPFIYEATGILNDRIFADSTARNLAIPSPVNGMSCYQTIDGMAFDYIAGSWIARAAGGVFPNGSTSVAGKFQAATIADQIAHTATGGTGALLIPVVGNLITTSAGAADGGKIAITDPSTGQFDPSLYNALSASVVTTKGDLIAATGNAAVDREGVGTDGQVYIADSTVPTGHKWGQVPLASGNFANGKTTRSNSASSGTVVIAHGLAATPKVVRTKAVTVIAATSISSSDGVWKSGTENSVGWVQNVNTPGAYTINASTSIYVELSVGNNQQATITADATNITYTFVKTGSGAGAGANIEILWDAEI